MTLAAPVGTRGRLIETARAYLDDEGLDGIGLREIARRAGLSHGAPLRHFPTLGRLLSAVAAEGFRELTVRIDEAVGSADSTRGIDRLASASYGYVHFAKSNPGVFALMFRRDLCDTTDPDYLTTGGVAFGVLVALVGEAQADGFAVHAPATEVAGVLWATMHGLASLHLHGALAPTTGQADLDVLVKLANALVFATMSPTQESRP